MKAKFKATVGSLLVGGVLAGAAVMPATGQAAQPGDLCWLHSGYGSMPVWNNPAGGTVIYYLGAGQAFRIVAYGDYNTYYGRGSGMSDGYLLRTYVNQATCTP